MDAQDDLLHDLACNHRALNRPETIYSRAADEIRRLNERLKDISILEGDLGSARKKIESLEDRIDFLSTPLKKTKE